MLKLTKDSHLDHALTAAHIRWILLRFGDMNGFFLMTVSLPEHLDALPCGLHGPIVGDEPVPEGECRLVTRSGRKGPSRLCDRPVRASRLITVIAGPHEDDACILYTAYGGPSAPREPYDVPEADVEGVVASKAFWAQHALSAPEETP